MFKRVHVRSWLTGVKAKIFLAKGEREVLKGVSEQQGLCLLSKTNPVLGWVYIISIIVAVVTLVYMAI